MSKLPSAHPAHADVQAAYPSQQRAYSNSSAPAAATHYREPSRAKVLRFSRAVFKDTATTDSELVSAFATALQALLVAYTRSLHNAALTNAPHIPQADTSQGVDA